LQSIDDYWLQIVALMNVNPFDNYDIPQDSRLICGAGRCMDAMVQGLTYKKRGSECQGDPLHAPQPTPESPATKLLVM
jgi:hypothetical protein